MIKAKLIAKDASNEFYLYKFEAFGCFFKMLCVENLGINIGEYADINFRSTDVVIALNPLLESSFCNVFSCEILDFSCSKILCNIKLRSKFGDFDSLITAESFYRLGLKKSQIVYACVKSTSIIAEKC